MPTKLTATKHLPSALPVRATRGTARRDDLISVRPSDRAAAQNTPTASTTRMRLSSWLIIFAASCPQTPAQSCPNLGSQWVAASWQPAPVALACPGAPAWPQWHLFIPAHRAPTPRAGFRPQSSRERPALLFQYRCTGLTFAPVALVRVRAMGYVVHMRAEPCR